MGDTVGHVVGVEHAVCERLHPAASCPSAGAAAVTRPSTEAQWRVHIRAVIRVVRPLTESLTSESQNSAPGMNASAMRSCGQDRRRPTSSSASHD